MLDCVNWGPLHPVGEMNKQQVYRELRHELSTQYHAELQVVRDLLESPAQLLTNGETQLHLDGPVTLPASGEAGKVFREEVADALGIILERYARNLAKEIDELGLR